MFVQTSLTFQQADNGKPDESWVLLDSQLTVDVFANKDHLEDIRKVKVPLKIYSTGGITTTDLIGMLPGYGWVWFYPSYPSPQESRRNSE